MENFLEISPEELQEFIDLTHNLYGHNFNGYSKESLRRRVLRLMGILKFNNFTEFKFMLSNQEVDSNYLLQEITVNTTEMFRNPEVFKYYRDEITPVLSTYPSLNIWHAACSTGEEMYSNAIILKEEGLLKRSVLYGSDINSKVLKAAKSGIYDLKNMREYSQDFLKTGTSNSLSDYYIVKYGHAKMNKSLSKEMVFAKHDLIDGKSFNQMHVIFCRNVFIYLTTEQKDAILTLFIDSLMPLGYLIIGKSESIAMSKHLNKFEIINGKLKIYRKKSI